MLLSVRVITICLASTTPSSILISVSTAVIMQDDINLIFGCRIGGNKLINNINGIPFE